MESLSWIFFCLSPFALFCSEDGNGLILCPLFIILGFVFKCAGSIGSTPRATVKVEPQKFWEWHYKDRIRSTFAENDSIGEHLMSYRDKEARRWATTICGYHNAWVPPEEKQEQIARACGVITEQMIKEKTIKKDRIQIGKYFLMNRLLFEYEDGDIQVTRRIKEDMKKITMSHHAGADDWYATSEYGITGRDMWEDLSAEEKEQVVEWVKEYKQKLIEAIRYYKSNMEFVIQPINMDY